MPSQTVELRNESGLHARPAAVFSKRAATFDCDVKVSKGETEANAKSVLRVLTLDCHQGDQITISTDGDDEDDALKALVELVESGIGE